MISVIIPTYRRYTYLRQAVQSVVQQNYSDIEIIIIDDHSGDETKKINKDFPQVHYIENDKNKGPGYSRKIGLKIAQGEYIVFLDDKIQIMFLYLQMPMNYMLKPEKKRRMN